MAISVLVAVDPIGDELVAKIERAGRRACKVGPGDDESRRWGRWSPGQHRDKVASYLDAGVADGATLAVDGREHPVTGDAADGFWLGPTCARPRHARA